MLFEERFVGGVGGFGFEVGEGGGWAEGVLGVAAFAPEVVEESSVEVGCCFD